MMDEMGSSASQRVDVRLLGKSGLGFKPWDSARTLEIAGSNPADPT